MTTSENRGTPPRRRSMKVRAAAVALSEYDNKPVAQWLREVAAGRDASPTSTS